MGRRVNDRQLEVLRWIADGCPEGRWRKDDFSYKVSAGALKSRGLVTIRGHAATWNAAITEAGAHYLEHGNYPAGSARPQRTNSDSRAGAVVNSAPLDLGEGATETLTQARALVQRLQQESGKISVTDPEDSTRAQYRRLLHACRVHRLVPDGHELRFTGRSSGDIVMVLSTGSPAEASDWDRIRTTARTITTNLGALRSALEGSSILDSISDELRPRAVDFLLDLAEQLRAHELRLGANVKLKTPKLFVQVDTRRRDLTLTEILENVPHVPTVAEQRELRRSPWKSIPKFDQVPSGRLHIRVARDGWANNKPNGDEWTDAKKSPLGRQVGEIARAIKKGVVDDDDAREREMQRRSEAHEAWEREQAAERRAWEELRSRARDKAVTQLREATFIRTFDAWRGAQELRSFAGQLEMVATTQGQLENRPRLREWLEWARARADEIDPMTNLEQFDDSVFDVEPSADDLRPHMEGWDPSAPHKDYGAAYGRPEQQAAHMPQPRPWHPGMRDKPSWWRH
ncbi:hypothetical protein [Xylanimonas cellulosilytica]|uniref:hypothetical protein n=1 Tax=Xylanimonas cellulosilytica TaxID=186189 RepID=UPI0011D07414|nr:hypothetical protein [Xylanimonas cellulosilytica]